MIYICIIYIYIYQVLYQACVCIYIITHQSYSHRFIVYISHVHVYHVEILFFNVGSCYCCDLWLEGLQATRIWFQASDFDRFPPFFNQRLLFADVCKTDVCKTYKQNNLILLNTTCCPTLLANQQWHLEEILREDGPIESLAPLKLLVVTNFLVPDTHDFHMIFT